MTKKGTVVVGMSGGVDSSVAALLLKEAGYDVIGVTMQLWQDEAEAADAHRSCCGPSAVEDAQRVASRLGILYSVMDFSEVFRRTVVSPFIEEYRCGRTPNPCIECNRHVKWEALLNRARQMGADYIATGHYAKVVLRENGRYAIACAESAAKDQTYALYGLTQDQLAHTLMPIGEYDKAAVRRIAEDAGLVVANKPDSQDICFVPDGDYAAFLARESGAPLPPEGDFVLTDGTVVGRHKGIHHYTIGQRKGLGIAWSEPLFVCELDVENNRVILGRNDDVFTNMLHCSDINLMGVPEIRDGDRYLAKIRYSHAGAMCTAFRKDESTLRLVFDEPVRAVTPGQAAVLYDGPYVAGGGVICG